MTRRRTLLFTALLLGLAAIIALPTIAQTNDPPPGRPILDDVWVTTQDRVNLRVGPGPLFEVLAVVPNATTLRATGRTAEGEWIQVAWEGEVNADAPEEATIDGVTYGWIAYWLLVWSGDILTLPVDGVETVSYARRVNPTITIDPGTFYYRDGVDPSTQIAQTVTEPTVVELTGRIGGPVDDGFYWIQFRLDGEYYWTATWETGNIVFFRELPDGGYIYSYGRLLIQLRDEISRNNSTLFSIARRWRDLDSAGTTSCNNIPRPAGILETSFTESDLLTAPVYIPPARALEEAIVSINLAIERFRRVCNQEERIIDAEEVRLALIDIEDAERNINLARLLLEPIGRRAPLLGNVPAGQ